MTSDKSRISSTLYMEIISNLNKNINNTTNKDTTNINNSISRYVDYVMDSSFLDFSHFNENHKTLNFEIVLEIKKRIELLSGILSDERESACAPSCQLSDASTTCSIDITPGNSSDIINRDAISISKRYLNELICPNRSFDSLLLELQMISWTGFKSLTLGGLDSSYTRGDTNSCFSTSTLSLDTFSTTALTQSIASCPQIESLELKDGFIQQTGQVLMKCITSKSWSRSIKTLVLKRLYWIDCKDWNGLLDSLETLTSLTVLELEENSYSDGFLSVTSSTSSIKSLESLIIKTQQVDECLFKKLHHHPRLNLLFLQDLRSDFQDELLDDLCHVVEKTNLQNFFLLDNVKNKLIQSIAKSKSIKSIMIPFQLQITTDLCKLLETSPSLRMLQLLDIDDTDDTSNANHQFECLIKSMEKNLKLISITLSLSPPFYTRLCQSKILSITSCTSTSQDQDPSIIKARVEKSQDTLHHLTRSLYDLMIVACNLILFPTMPYEVKEMILNALMQEFQFQEYSSLLERRALLNRLLQNQSIARSGCCQLGHVQEQDYFKTGLQLKMYSLVDYLLH